MVSSIVRRRKKQSIKFQNFTDNYNKCRGTTSLDFSTSQHLRRGQTLFIIYMMPTCNSRKM